MRNFKHTFDYPEEYKFEKSNVISHVICGHIGCFFFVFFTLKTSSESTKWIEVKQQISPNSHGEFYFATMTSSVTWFGGHIGWTWWPYWSPYWWPYWIAAKPRDSWTFIWWTFIFYPPPRGGRGILLSPLSSVRPSGCPSVRPAGRHQLQL